VSIDNKKNKKHPYPLYGNDRFIFIYKKETVPKNLFVFHRHRAEIHLSSYLSPSSAQEK